MFSFRFASVGLILVASGCLSYAAPVGPVSPLYLTNGGGIEVVQGTSIINSWYVNNGGEYSIAVDGDVRTLSCGGCNSINSGAQYTLGGAYTGVDYPNPMPDAYDSTTDGTFNYLISYSGNVYQTNRNFSNPLILFSLGTFINLGITYDETNNSLWISSYTGTSVTDYTLSGSVLSSFSTGHNYNSALALDHADQTLWLMNRNTSTLEQYSKSGIFLGTGITVNGGYGGEFNFAGAGVPEPATCSLFGSGLLALIAVCHRKRHS